MYSQEQNIIMPAFKEKNIAACFVCSDEYSSFTGVTITSIVKNSSDKYNYDIWVLTYDITDRNKHMMQLCTENRSNFSLRFFDINKFIEGKEFYVWNQFSPTTYFRLLIPDIFSNYSKMLYLDSDIIINHDIAELYETNLDGYLMAAAHDTHVVGSLQSEIRHEQYDYYMNVLGVTDCTSYFQCGVSLYNILEFNKTFAPGVLFNEAAQSRLLWLDQDFINIKAKGRILPLSNRWNVMVINDLNNIDEDHLREDMKKEYYEARENPYIVHYVGKSIPCFSPRADFCWLYWYYARQSCYYEIILSVMNEHMYQQRQAENTFKKRFKNGVVMPVVNVFFPKHSKRRKKLKKLYFKMRGWDCSAF